MSICFYLQTVKLYERCLIPCANYPEFWVRYIELMEASGAREIATHAIERAVTSSLKVKSLKGPNDPISFPI